MNPADEEKITRWIDGEISDDEVNDILRQHPELHREKESARMLGATLRKELGGDGDIPFPEFFNHQLRRQLEEEHSAEERKQAYRNIPEKEFFSWFRWSRNLAGAAFLLLLGVFIGVMFFQPPSLGSEVVSTYTPDAGVEARLFYSEDARATVLLLEGLEAIPADREIGGHKTANYTPGPGGKVPALYSANQSGRAYVLVKDANQTPSVYEVDVHAAEAFQ